MNALDLIYEIDFNPDIYNRMVAEAIDRLRAAIWDAVAVHGHEVIVWKQIQGQRGAKICLIGTKGTGNPAIKAWLFAPRTGDGFTTTVHRNIEPSDIVAEVEEWIADYGYVEGIIP